jgi:hypothetical protein
MLDLYNFEVEEKASKVEKEATEDDEKSKMGPLHTSDHDVYNHPGIRGAFMDSNNKIIISVAAFVFLGCLITCFVLASRVIHTHRVVNNRSNAGQPPPPDASILRIRNERGLAIAAVVLGSIAGMIMLGDLAELHERGHSLDTSNVVVTFVFLGIAVILTGVSFSSYVK